MVLTTTTTWIVMENCSKVTSVIISVKTAGLIYLSPSTTEKTFLKYDFTEPDQKTETSSSITVSSSLSVAAFIQFL